MAFKLDHALNRVLTSVFGVIALVIVISVVASTLLSGSKTTAGNVANFTAGIAAQATSNGGVVANIPWDLVGFLVLAFGIIILAYKAVF